MFEPKLPAISASIGFLLSFLVGITSGASILSVLARALAMGIMFGLFAVGARYLVERFLPELGAGESAPSESQGSGGVVDITIGEAGKDESPFKMADKNDFGDMIPDFLAPASRSAPDFPTTEESSEKPEQPDFRLSARYDSGVPPSGDPQAAGAQRQPGQVSQGIGNSAARQSPSGSTDGSVPRGVSDGDLDVLPDLQDFVPTVRPDESGEDEDVSSGMGGGTRIHDSLFSAPETKTSSIESETMVKAIRTILSRDK